MNRKPQPTPSPPLVPGSRRGQPGRPKNGDAGLFGTHEHGHTMGTATHESPTRSGSHDGAAVQHTVVPIGPRLLDLQTTALYLGLSEWTVRDLEAAGVVPRIRIPLPHAGELRKLLFDRNDLDQLIEAWKETR